ncbi:long-chain fatty acid--CoA ligase [Hoeflea prorocentri]|uniref:Long-chain-fatty-acid--CoA ligase n=1 Tax=Hoeflea prorocentri TaxID=1922333 RepID=A0A9X3ZI87_9HYPH|nr:long-chain fatty acid--CoA ligase [Hoeflea prorocentri]MCY6382677.1 long-chain fatty acid--CoA ligase [Hoeflea prorocentri]MDA5400477.1 long-chain fatty acid--CoA ligase [Hoeflea prorocentri]
MTTASGKTASASAEKIWLKSYPEGTPAEIDTLEHSSVGGLIKKACTDNAPRPAYTCMGKTITYGELDTYASQVGAWLQSLGLEKGDRVAIMMPNILQYPIAAAAVLQAGYVVVNVNPLYTPRELEHQLKDSGAKAIFILENFAVTLQQVVGNTDVKHVCVATMGDMMGLKGLLVNFVVRRVKKMVPDWSLPGHVPFKAALAAGAGMSFKPADCGPDDVAFLQYTGGTTGVSKGATLSNRNILSNAAQNHVWLEALKRKEKLPDQLVYICCLPLYHIFALTVNAIMGMDQGAHNVLIPNPRDIPGFVKELGKYEYHVLPGLNTLFNALLANEDFRKLDFSALKLTLGGGMAVQRPVAERWRDLTGCSISEGYGLSETSPVATANRFDGDGEFSGSIGLPLPSTDIDIRDDDGKSLPLGEVGEICIRGPQVMVGYWNRPDETAKVMTEDNFFRSGDMGYMDEDGYVRIVDRKKDMVLVSGFNVYPNEVEEVAVSHDGILEAAAVGVPDEHSGEVVKLFVVKSDPALSEADVKNWCKDKLTNYKRPRYIEFRDELPKTNVGKILRRELRDEDIAKSA